MQTQAKRTLGTNSAPAQDTSDHELVTRVVAGDETALEQLMRRHNQRLFRIARSIVRDPDAARDVVQKTYVNAYYRLPEYRPTGNFGAWLCRITMNEALMIVRRQRHEAAASDEQIAGLPGRPAEEPPNALANDELRSLLERAIDSLADPLRIVFVMRAIEQMSVADTANTLNLHPATVKTRYHRARKLLRTALETEVAAAGGDVFEFAGTRCDEMCRAVLERTKLNRHARIR